MTLSPRLAAPLARGAWIAVGLLWFVGMLNYLDRLVITAMREPVIASIPMTEAQFGLLTSIFLWVYGFLSPVCGFLGDKISRKRVIFVSLLVWSGVTWATAHAQNFDQLFWARALMGISEACYLPAALALISDYHRGATRSFATAIHGTGIFAGGALGGIGGYLAESMGWRGTFTLLGAIGVGYALVLLIFLKDAPDPEETVATAPAREPVRVGTALKAMFNRPTFAFLLLVNSMVGVANWTIYGWLPTFLRERFHLSAGSAGLTATATLQIASFAGILLGGRISDVLSRRHLRARMLVPAFGYVAAAPALVLMSLSDMLPLALGGLVVYGIARGFFDANLMPIVRQTVDERYSATAYGMLNMIGCFTGGIMTYVGGGLRDAGISLSIAFLICAAGIFLTALLLLWLKPTTPSLATPSPSVPAVA
jgi:MFS family permease